MPIGDSERFRIYTSDGPSRRAIVRIPNNPLSTVHGVEKRGFSGWQGGLCDVVHEKTNFVIIERSGSYIRPSETASDSGSMRLTARRGGHSYGSRITRCLREHGPERPGFAGE